MEKKIRFATAIRNFSRRKGGAERYIVDLCTRMAKEGHEVHVYAEHWEEEVQGIHLHRMKTIPFPKSLRLLSFAIKATREMKSANYDVTLGVGNTLEADVLQPHGGVHWAWFWKSLKAYDNPILWVIKLLGRILSPKQWVSGWIEDRPYKRGNYSKIVAISDMVKEDIIQRYKVSEDRIAVVYNGTDIERFHPRNRRYREEIRERHGIANEFVILFVSNNFRMKGLFFLMRALADLKNEGAPPFKLLVLGRDRKASYLRLAKKINISEETVFAGSTDEPEKYYGTADLLVHPSFYDACSLTVLEALASGVPVITTFSNGASGVIHPEEGRVIRDPKNLEELKEAVRYFLESGVQRPPLLQEGKRMEDYSDRVNFDQMMRVFREITPEC
ncbi:MAG: glycosyltransferase family 4 protein [Thermodesulfobacteriota bacterium]|nr:glycosyltransferase family 4 protein [Thermodesulfobacteriota bacterium]